MIQFGELLLGLVLGVTAAGPVRARDITGVALAPGWDSSMQGGSAAMRELGVLLSAHVQPAANLAHAPNIEIYRGIHYLMPLDEALVRLGLQTRIKSKSSVIYPGLPRSSLFGYAFDGAFDGDYNRIYLVTDTADQVVSVQLVSESPLRLPPKAKRKADSNLTCYNFINYRVKAISNLQVYHDVRSVKDVIQIDSVLIDRPPVGRSRSGRGGTTRAPKERVVECVRWYVPRPLAELILVCVSKSGSSF